MFRFLVWLFSPVVLGFSGGSTPAPRPIQANPVADERARQQRENEARAAQAEAQSRGRRSTILAGADSDEENLGASMAPARKRGAAASALGSK
jgi:hypothetical protein